MSSFFGMLLTVVGGIIVFIIIEYLKEVWLMPFQEYKKIKQQISYALTYYANLYTNTIVLSEATKKGRAQYSTASDNVRDLACKLGSFNETLSWFRMGIPSSKIILDASSCLIGLSNSFFCNGNEDFHSRDETNIQRAQTVKSYLKL